MTDTTATAPAAQPDTDLDRTAKTPPIVGVVDTLIEETLGALNGISNNGELEYALGLFAGRAVTFNSVRRSIARIAAIGCLKELSVDGPAKLVDGALAMAAAAEHSENGTGSGAAFKDVELWGDPVDGADLLNTLEAFFRRFLILPTGAADVLAAFALVTHVADVFRTVPYLALESPTPECGKTRVLEILALLSARPWFTLMPSTAVLFRVLEINPDESLSGRKRRRKREATQTPYLERDDVVALLDAAARLDREPSRHIPDRQVRLAVLCYTGMRRNEAMGLLVSDVDLDRNLIHVRPNTCRPNLKTATSHRVVPLFSDLRALLVPWIGDRREGLLFPSPSGQMYRDIRGLLTGALKAAEITTRITVHGLRHTFTAARLQSLDGGHPVSAWTVACELGHRNVTLIERVYGHLLRDRSAARTEGVSYRPAKRVHLEVVA